MKPYESIISFSSENILWTISIGLFFSYLIKRHLRIRSLAKKMDKIPGPKPFPIIGNALQIVSSGSNLIKKIEGRFQRFGSIFRIWFGSEPMICISEADQIEVILNSSQHIEKAIFYTQLERWLGEGLLLAKGTRWHTHRKLLTPAFHFKILEIFQTVFASKSNVLVERLEKFANGKETFDLYSLISSATLDIICESALGVNVKAQEEEQSEYVKSIYEMTKVVSFRNRRIWLQSEFIFKLTPYGKIFNRCLTVLQEFTKNIIFSKSNGKKCEKTINKKEDDDLNAGIKNRVALLDLLLEADVSEKAICEEVDTFTFENRGPRNEKMNRFGHDTTSAGISFCLFLLGCHPDIQARLHRELDDIFEGQRDRPLTMADLSRMKLLERAIKETLRLYPPVPLIGRVLDHDALIGGYEIPKAVNVGLFIYFLHRDPKHFPDPEKFDPDRFAPENCKGRHPFAYLPFSAGPRNCIGQRFAMHEEKTILASILRKYKIISMEKQEDLKILFELVLRSENGFKVRIEKRNI